MYSQSIDTEVALEKVKKAGVSLNELIFGIITLTLSEMIDEKNEV